MSKHCPQATTYQCISANKHVQRIELIKMGRETPWYLALPAFIYAGPACEMEKARDIRHIATRVIRQSCPFISIVYAHLAELPRHVSCGKLAPYAVDPKSLLPLVPTYKLALPLLSNGKIRTSRPAAMNSAPLTYTGALVSRFANMATIGAMIPKMRFALAVIAFPVPRSFVGKISGV